MRHRCRTYLHYLTRDRGVSARSNERAASSALSRARSAPMPPLQHYEKISPHWSHSRPLRVLSKDRGRGRTDGRRAEEHGYVTRLQWPARSLPAAARANDVLFGPDRPHRQTGCVFPSTRTGSDFEHITTAMCSLMILSPSCMESPFFK